MRLCLGIQLDAKYVDVMVQRWQTRNGETAKLSRLTAGPSRAVPKATCGTGNGAACWPARSGEALPAAARLVQRLAVDPADDGFENLHSAPAPRNGLRCAKFRSAASSHSRNAVWRVKLGVYAGFYTLLTAVWVQPRIGESLIIRLSTLAVIRCAAGCGPKVPATSFTRAVMCPGGLDSASAHQMVPAENTQLPFPAG